jgi:hypothetical protein
MRKARQAAECADFAAHARAPAAPAIDSESPARLSCALMWPGRRRRDAAGRPRRNEVPRRHRAVRRLTNHPIQRRGQTCIEPHRICAPGG